MAGSRVFLLGFEFVLHSPVTRGLCRPSHVLAPVSFSVKCSWYSVHSTESLWGLAHSTHLYHAYYVPDKHRGAGDAMDETHAVPALKKQGGREYTNKQTNGVLLTDGS